MSDSCEPQTEQRLTPLPGATVADPLDLGAVDGADLVQTLEIEAVGSGASTEEVAGWVSAATDPVGPTRAPRPAKRLSETSAAARRAVVETVPLAIMVFLTALYALRFSTLVMARHNDFGSFDYDLGIYDQGIWLLGRGRQFLTVRGMPLLGHHWNPILYLYVPAYYVGAGPNLLNVSQAFAVAGGAIPIYFATKKLAKSAWIGLILAVAYLGHPSSGWLIQELFHPETMAIPFVLAAWAFAEYRRWRWYTVAVVISLLWKEDVALAVAFLGLVVVWRKNKKYALLTFGGSLLFFLVATKLFIPLSLGRAPFYEEFFGPLGKTPTDLVKTAFTHPSRYESVLRDHGAEQYAHHILRPFGYVSLLSPSSLLIGLPQALVNLLNTLGFVWNPRFHYIAMPLASATIGASRGVASRSKHWRRWALALVVLVAVFGMRNSGVGPWSAEFDNGNWPLVRSHRAEVLSQALRVVPDDPAATTASPYFITPHLTHRYEAYTFPNPWKASYWAVNGENQRSGDRVDYVVMDEQVLSIEDRAVYDLAVVGSGEFAEVFREGSIVVWKRVRPGNAGPAGTVVDVPPATAEVPTATPPAAGGDPASTTLALSNTSPDGAQTISAAVTVEPSRTSSAPAATITNP